MKRRLGRNQGHASDWHGARVSSKYKENYDKIFGKREEEEKPKHKATIEGTNQRYKLVPNDEEM